MTHDVCAQRGEPGGLLYVPIPDAEVDADRRATAQEVADRAGELLPLQGPPQIVWCQPGTGPGAFHGEPRPGWVNREIPDTIFLDTRYPVNRQTVYHEARHLWQAQTGWEGPQINGSAHGMSGQQLAREFDAADWAGRTIREEAS